MFSLGGGPYSREVLNCVRTVSTIYRYLVYDWLALSAIFNLILRIDFGEITLVPTLC